MTSEIIPLARPDITENDILEVVRVLRTGMLVQGKEVQKLENVVSGFLEKEFCSAVSNGTASLHLALISLGIGHGDEVIVPAFSFIATANVVELVGAKCMFADTHPRYFTIDVSKIESLVTNKTKAIIPVHEFGLCADMPEIMILAKKYNLKVIEDAACALGATFNDQFAGTAGHFGCFSLHPRKAITSGEGGLIVTSDPLLDNMVKTIRNHGIETNSSPMNFMSAGFNYRMTDFQAALAGSQFKRLEKILDYKNQLASIYFNEIKHPGIQLPQIPFEAKHTWQTFHILLGDEIKRNELAKYLKENGILTNYGAQCIPAMKYYRDKYQHDYIKDFSNSFHAYTCGLAIPLYERLTKEQVLRISHTINKFK
jgi:perosamine synthetase